MVRLERKTLSWLMLLLTGLSLLKMEKYNTFQYFCAGYASFHEVHKSLQIKHKRKVSYFSIIMVHIIILKRNAE